MAKSIIPAGDRITANSYPVLFCQHMLPWLCASVHNLMELMFSRETALIHTAISKQNLERVLAIGAG
jgi:hypothetical protein